MKKTITLPLFFTLFISFFYVTVSNIMLAQNEVANVLVYDVIYMKNGKILKGEILIFEEKDGDLTFKDLQGKKYSITREEYDYFVEDKRYFVAKNDTLVIRPRKEKEIEISLGFSVPILFQDNTFKADTNYESTSWGSTMYTPLSIKAGVGKYINRQNFVGANLEIGLSSKMNYYNIAARYFHQYDAYKKNVSFYIPFEVSFFNINSSHSFLKVDTLDAYNYTDQISVNHKILGLSLGQGVSFILNNKKSISLEMTLIKGFTISEKFIDIEGIPEPNISSAFKGLKFSFFYNI